MSGIKELGKPLCSVSQGLSRMPPGSLDANNVFNFMVSTWGWGAALWDLFKIRRASCVLEPVQL